VGTCFLRHCGAMWCSRYLAFAPCLVVQAVAWLRAEAHAENQPYTRCASASLGFKRCSSATCPFLSCRRSVPWIMRVNCSCSSLSPFVQLLACNVAILGECVAHCRWVCSPCSQKAPETCAGRYVQSFKRKFAEQEFCALQRRLLGPTSLTKQCGCLVAVRSDMPLDASKESQVSPVTNQASTIEKRRSPGSCMGLK